MFEQGVARVAKINGKGRRLIQPPNNLYLNRDARTLTLNQIQRQSVQDTPRESSV